MNNTELSVLLRYGESLFVDTAAGDEAADGGADGNGLSSARLATFEGRAPSWFLSPHVNCFPPPRDAVCDGGALLAADGSFFAPTLSSVLQQQRGGGAPAADFDDENGGGGLQRVPTIIPPYPAKLIGASIVGGSFAGSHFSGAGLTDSSFAFTNTSLAISHTASGPRVQRMASNTNGDALALTAHADPSSQHWWTTKTVASSHSFVAAPHLSHYHQYQHYVAPRRARTAAFCVPERPFAAPSASPLIAWYDQTAAVFAGNSGRVADCLQRLWGVLALDGGREAMMPNAKTLQWALEVLSDQRVRNENDYEHNGSGGNALATSGSNNSTNNNNSFFAERHYHSPRTNWANLSLKEVLEGSRPAYRMPNRPRTGRTVFEASPAAAATTHQSSQEGTAVYLRTSSAANGASMQSHQQQQPSIGMMEGYAASKGGAAQPTPQISAARAETAVPPLSQHSQQQQQCDVAGGHFDDGAAGAARVDFMAAAARARAPSAGPLTLRTAVPSAEALATPDGFETLIRVFCDRTMRLSAHAKDYAEVTRSDTLSGAIILFTRFLQKEAERMGRGFADIIYAEGGVSGGGGGGGPYAHSFTSSSSASECQPLPDSDYTWSLPPEYLPPALAHLRANRFRLDLALEACLQLAKVQYDSVRPPLPQHYASQVQASAAKAAALSQQQLQNGHHSNTSEALRYYQQLQHQLQEAEGRARLLQAYRSHVLAVLDYDIIAVAPHVFLEPLEWSTVACPARRVPAARVKRERELLRRHGILPPTAVAIDTKAGTETAAGVSPIAETPGGLAAAAEKAPEEGAVSSATDGGAACASLSSLSAATESQAQTSLPRLVVVGASAGGQTAVGSDAPDANVSAVTAACSDGHCGGGVGEAVASRTVSAISSAGARAVPTISGLIRHQQQFACASACSPAIQQQQWLAMAAASVLPPTVAEDPSWNDMDGYCATKEEVSAMLYGPEDGGEVEPAAAAACALGGHTPFAYLLRETTAAIDVLLQHSSCLAAAHHPAWVAGSALIATVFRLFPARFTPSVVDAYLHNLEHRYGEHVARCVAVAYAIVSYLYGGAAAATATSVAAL